MPVQEEEVKGQSSGLGVVNWTLMPFNCNMHCNLIRQCVNIASVFQTREHCQEAGLFWEEANTF